MSGLSPVSTILSLIAIIAGLVVERDPLASHSSRVWTALFIATAALTSATGFAFTTPFGPSHVVGVISLVLLAGSTLALYVFRLAGRWRWMYAISQTLAKFLLLFVLVAQVVKKVPAWPQTVWSPSALHLACLAWQRRRMAEELLACSPIVAQSDGQRWGRDQMKRLVICYDGTWNAVTKPDEVTNVVRMAQAVKSVASDDVEQVVYYNAGVGSGGPLDQFLGGVFGVGLRNNVKRGLAFLSLNWDPQEPDNPVADEIYIFGFSRGAYSARALAGVIGAIGGIPKQSSFDELEEIWNHYRKSEEKKERDKEEDAKKIADWIYPMSADRKPIIKCLGVWDTVGSYGIPAGLGLGALARKLTSWTRGFHDNEIGDEIELGLHAMAIDEARRSFPATSWVTRKAEDRSGVEQVWFAGAHSNVGGGYKECGLSDLALIWMIARVRDQTGLQFDEDYIKEHFWPCAACSLYRSNRGWLISGLLPFRRQIREHAKRAQEGVERLINDKVHWSVRERLGKVAIVDEHRYLRYAPKNLPKHADIAEQTQTEMNLIALCRGSAENKKKQGCALHRRQSVARQGWRERWRSRRFRRFCKEWAEDEAASG